MPKEEWGVKRLCPKCAVRFYDLQKDPMTCPSCGASFDVASLVQQKSRSAAPEKVAKVLEPAPADDLDVVVDLEEESSDDLDDDLLEDDDDDTVALEEIADVAATEDES